MKKIILLLTLILPLLCSSQLKKDDDGTLYYEEVIETDLSIAEIHDAIEQYLATYSDNSNYVIKINKEDQILAKGDIPIIGPNELNIVLNTEFKEGRYRIFINELMLNKKDPFTNDEELNTKIALDQMEKRYSKQGKLSEFQKLKKSGEAEKHVSGFVEMNKFFYPKGETKLLAFVEDLKQYISDFNSDSDW
ncbi:hypothetical protein RM545_06455 [Zunongwangia sp. F260]|uniref:DUF4468 domain-containing protein n=1 Tax=Autumnicola lenta TaxID=3075593 RepID=A0ABU3CIZ1_9FLAO|nr:hypothetical protein [Zunongwangia sp. F260]MDT0646326.1 hypothetical protein [Zunongwangia sp. F260]